MESQREDVFFYIDLIKDALKKKDVIKSIKFYIEEKKKINVKGHFALLIFQEEGNPVFIVDKKDEDIIINSIEENWNLRSKKDSFFENGLFYIFSYIAETVRKKSKLNRIIIITDTPSDLNAEYQEALFNLVSKIKYFPTFIDIIRVSAEKGKRFYKDDVKLNILASDTKGGIFYVQNKKEFFDVFKKLVKNKQLVSTFADRPDQIEINIEDYAFYNKLAKKLKKSNEENLKCYFCKEELCPLCSDVNDVPLICENCGTAFHDCCVSNYLVDHHVVLPHIFRCPNPNCNILLKIKEKIVFEEDTTTDHGVEKEALEDIPIITDVEDIKIESIEDYQLDKPQEMQLEQEQHQSEKEKTAEGELKKIKIGGFFGKEYVIKKVGNKIIYDRSTKSISKIESRKETVEKTKYWKGSGVQAAKKKTKIAICPICGFQIKLSEQKSYKCPNCGTKL
ncbi:MAG: hypothetical protein ACTSUT_17720 [Promethearchaeota archaeon]